MVLKHWCRFFVGMLILSGLAAMAGAVELSWERNYDDFSVLPVITLSNKEAQEKTGEVRATLTDPDGKLVCDVKIPYTLAAGKSETIEPFARYSPLRQTLLCCVEDTASNAKLSGIFGVSKPVDGKNRDLLVGMVAHEQRYEADICWRMLRMMRDAGVKTCRTGLDFANAGNPEKEEQAIRKLEEDVLGLEAFGIRPMANVGYFPNQFYDSPEKSLLAYRWAKKIAARFAGRVDWHFGNETNSGWAAFGAAADMAALHKAFVLGSRAGDPDALCGTFGIAEADPAYVDAFLRCGTDGYFDALAIHPYCGTPEAGVAKMAAAMSRLKPGAQLWATEFGFYVIEGDSGLNELTRQLTLVAGYSAQQQADFLLRGFVAAKSIGVDRIYWYNFFGLNDPETFWIVRGDFTPTPAYHALEAVSKVLDGVEALGGTPLDETVQRHLFRRADGSVIEILWTTGAPQRVDRPELEGAEISGLLGQDLKRDGSSVELTQTPIVARLSDSLRPAAFVNRAVVASALDGRTFWKPQHRFTVKPGETVEVPMVLFNSLKTPVTARPEIRERMPGWKIVLPEKIDVKPESGSVGKILLTAPAQVTPGVEYLFAFGADLGDGTRTEPYEIRVRVPGAFPWREIAEHRVQPDYPMYDPFEEGTLKTGRMELAANHAGAQVDGRLDEWKPEEFMELDQVMNWILRDSGVPCREDFSAKVALRWDENNLYCAFLVSDDDLSLLDAVSRDWRDNDNLRVFLSREPDREKRSGSIGESELLLIFSPTDPEKVGGPIGFSAALGGFSRPGFERELTMASSVWQGGSVVEVAIPWKAWGVLPESGLKLGCNVLADDADDGFRQHTGMLRAESPGYWNDPRTLAVLTLK